MGRQQVFDQFFRSKASLKVSSSPKCSFVYKRAFFSKHCILQGHLKLSPLFFSFSGRVGKIRVLSFKIGLVTMARAHLEDKYKCKNLKVWFFFVDAYIFSCVVQLKKGLMPFSDLYRLVTDEKGLMDHKQLGLLLHDSLQVKLKANFIFTEIVHLISRQRGGFYSVNTGI